MRKILYVMIFIILYILAAYVTNIIINRVEKNISTELFNEGICDECGGHYIFRNTPYEGCYYYSCDKCNRVVETYIKMETGVE